MFKLNMQPVRTFNTSSSGLYKCKKMKNDTTLTGTRYEWNYTGLSIFGTIKTVLSDTINETHVKYY